MAIYNRIHLGGPCTYVDDGVANEVLYPGEHVERLATGKWQKANSALTEAFGVHVVLEHPAAMQGISTAYGIGDQVIVGFMTNGSLFLTFLHTSQDISITEYLSPQGGATGNWKSAGATTAAAGIAKVRALEAKVTTGTRTLIKVEGV
jgi:hypothetical protein